jgi:hypothetical protein
MDSDIVNLHINTSNVCETEVHIFFQVQKQDFVPQVKYKLANDESNFQGLGFGVDFKRNQTSSES